MIKPGIYVHYKGNRYELLAIANYSETLEKMVVYKALYGKDKYLVRPLSMWEELVEVNGEQVSRFRYVSSKDENTTVYLEDIAEKLEETIDCWEQYLNIRTGEFEALSDGTYIETDDELAERIEESEDYIRLPNQREIREYDIMEDFAASIENAEISSRLFSALSGRKPFRHFKDEINYLGIAKEYYQFKSALLLRIARDWCEENNIKYKRKTNSSSD